MYLGPFERSMSLCKTLKFQFINTFNLHSKGAGGDCTSSQGRRTTGKVHVGTPLVFVFYGTESNMTNPFYGVEDTRSHSPHSRCTGLLVAACPELAM